MRRLLLPCSVLLALLPAAGASASERRTLSAPQPATRVCQDRVADGAAGVDTTRFAAERAGLVSVALDGGSGDWDLAVFDAGGALHESSASFGAQERVDTFVQAGDRLVVQGCRRSGSSATAAAELTFTPYDPPADPFPARLVRVPFGLPTDVERLEATGLDVTHAHDDDGATVVVHGPEDERRLRSAGFTSTTVVEDLRAADLRSAEIDAARAAQAGRSALPSGRETYRAFGDYGADLKALAEGNPGVVKPVTIGRSLENRPIDGVEIAEGVERTDDGRPVLAVLGLHHAREWPSGEMPMEFATDLAARYRAGDPRVTDLLRRVRVLVLPMMNPDGFAVSRGAGPSPADDNDEATAPLSANDQSAYKRKNCRPTNNDAAVPCAMRTRSGVDLNRNYGAYWGGVGTSSSPDAQNFRGSAPFSEPESEAFHRVSQTRPIVTVISHHTFTDEGTWLRQPGFCQTPPAGCQSPYPEDQGRDVLGRPGEVPPPPYDLTPDEAGMKALGDAMGQATGWQSQLGWVIGEITGATEDWNYFAAGAYGFTPEQRGPNFHPTYAQAVVAEYAGSGPGSGGGVREALLRAAEQAGDASKHSVLTGTGEAGATLRLVKQFSTATSLPNLFVEDRLDLSTTVGRDGRFTWHVNPSTRPLATAKEAYVLRCEIGGRVVSSREVTVDRAQRLDVGDACDPTILLERTTVVPAVGSPSRRRARRPVLVVSRRAARARTVNRQRRLRVGLRVDGVLRTVRVRFVDARNRTILAGSVRSLARDRVLTLRRVRVRGRLRVARRGRHRVIATAIDRDGVVVRATRRVVLRR